MSFFRGKYIMNDLLEKDNDIQNDVQTDVDPENTPDTFDTDKKAKSKKTLLYIFCGVFAFLCLCVFSVFMFVHPAFVYSEEGDVHCQIGNNFSYPDCKIKYLFFDITNKAEKTNNVNTDTIGDYSVTYSLSVFGRQFKSTKKVLVRDEIPPIIELTGEKEITLSSPDFFVEDGFSAEDGYDGDLTLNVVSKQIRKDGEYFIEYTVKDSSGNIGKAERKLIIKDIVPPVITLNGENELFLNVPEYSEAGYVANDDVDGDITPNVVFSSDYTAYTEGDFTFTYSVTDSSGNKTEIQRKVHVKDDVPPYITLNGPETMYIKLGEKYEENGGTAFDAFEGNLTSKMEISGYVDTTAVGKYEVLYTSSDSKSNLSQKVRKITVYEPNTFVEGAVNGQGVVSDSTIYLTFDDGPSNKVTPRVLDILKANNIKATFFIINYSDANKPLIQRMINEGHTIGIHGYTHDFPTAYASVDAYINNIKSLRQKLLDDFGYDTNIIRFLGGSSNTISKKYRIGIMSELCPLVESLGYTYFDWNVSSGDADGNTIAKNTIINNVTKGVRKNRSNVVLMHDINTKTTTADALQSIINYGLSNGYTFAGLSSYTPAVHHSIQN